MLTSISKQLQAQQAQLESVNSFVTTSMKEKEIAKQAATMETIRQEALTQARQQLQQQFQQQFQQQLQRQQAPAASSGSQPAPLLMGPTNASGQPLLQFQAPGSGHPN